MRPHRHLLLCGTAAFALALVGCSSTPTDTGPESGAGRVVSTVRGDITVPETPERVVVLDAQSVDIVSSLGVAPAAYDVGASEDMRAMPWLEGAVDGEFDPGLVGTDVKVNFEAVLAADPDLIIMDEWVAEGETFERLTAIAPTVTSDTEEAASWQDRTSFLGKALGLDKEAENVIAATESAIAEAARDLEPLEGETYEYIAFSQEQGGFWYGNGAWLEDFGLVPAENQDNTHQNMTIVSLENITDYTADVVALWAMTEADRAAVESNALFATLPAVQADKMIWLDFALANATNTPGPLSAIYTVETVVPQLRDAIAD